MQESPVIFARPIFFFFFFQVLRRDVAAGRTHHLSSGPFSYTMSSREEQSLAIVL